jgi:hypothetical protein
MENGGIAAEVPKSKYDLRSPHVQVGWGRKASFFFFLNEKF